jgi:hypothetical protein
MVKNVLNTGKLQAVVVGNLEKNVRDTLYFHTLDVQFTFQEVESLITSVKDIIVVEKSDVTIQRRGLIIPEGKLVLSRGTRL